MAIQDTLGPFHSEDLLDPYKIASALNQLYAQIAAVGGGGGGGSVVPAGAVPEATRTVMQTLTFDVPPDTIRTNGWDTVGYGGGLYVKAPGNVIPVHWPASGVLTIGVGGGATYYLIWPDRNEYWVEQFGARGRAASDRTDQWQAFEDCKAAILLQPDVQGWAAGASSEGGVTMRAGRGAFYSTKSVSFSGGAFRFDAAGPHNGGTLLMSPGNVDFFQTQDSFSSYPTFGHEGGTLNGFARLLGSLCYVAGQTHVYRSTNTGIPDMGNPPTGTGGGTITSGSATFLYVRELTWQEQIRAGASYTELRNFTCGAVWNVLVDGWDEDQTAIDGGYHCGILARCRTTIENVYCLSYAGHGICIAGDGGTECRGGGIPNNSIVRNYRGYFNGHAALRFDGTDANACLAEIIDTGSNKRAGVESGDFLGNRYVHLQDAFSGSPGNVGTARYGACTHLGYHYIAAAPEIGSFNVPNYTLEPGTAGSEFSWILTDGDGTAASSTNYPIWNSSLFFWPAGPFIAFNVNQENQILGLYVEGGGYGPQLGLYDMAWGGALGNRFSAHRGGNMYARAEWLNQMKVYTEFPFADGLRSRHSFLGGRTTNAGKPTEGADTTYWGYTDYEGNTIRCHSEAPGGVRAYANADVYIRNDASPNFIMGWTGNNTTRTFGQSVVQREMPYFPRLVLGSGGADMSDAAAMIFQTTNSFLGTGSGDATGDRAGRIYFYANDPAPGDPWGWQVRHVGGNLRFIPLYP